MSDPKLEGFRTPEAQTLRTLIVCLLEVLPRCDTCGKLATHVSARRLYYWCRSHATVESARLPWTTRAEQAASMMHALDKAAPP